MSRDCEVCGPLPGDQVHDTCHSIPGLSTSGCGHKIADHSPNTLCCRICGKATDPETWCGRDPAPWPRDKDGKALRATPDQSKETTRR